MDKRSTGSHGSADEKQFGPLDFKSAIHKWLWAASNLARKTAAAFSLPETTQEVMNIRLALLTGTPY